MLELVGHDVLKQLTNKNGENAKVQIIPLVNILELDLS